MPRTHRLRAGVNWLTLATPAGLLLARLGGATLHPGPERLWLATGYRLRLPLAPAFTVGSVILTSRPEIGGQLLVHEARHASQYAALGPLFLPIYGLCAGYSWAVAGDWGSHNPFERLAGLSDGGYQSRPFRSGMTRFLANSETRRHR
jgi:hypothetical protein